MKTKKTILALMALIVGITFSSCEKINGKGDTVNESRGITGYSGISLSMSATVYFSPDTNYALEIQGQQNVIDHIITQVEGNDLVIKMKPGVHLGNHDPIRIYVTAPEVTRIDISGSGDIYVDAPWTGAFLSVNISGSGNISVSMMVAEQFHAGISGSGNIKVMGGNTGKTDLKISGSGNIDMREVQAGEVETTTSGSGDIYVHALDILDVTISGSGDIYYLGTPVINTHISGSGNLRHL